MLFDPERKWVVDAAKFQSKSRNCPFDGWRLRGAVLMTVLGGREVYERDS
ncbi:MAG: hypothetical protein IJR68_00390 [Fretibacterium sp.]|nr:hypothetical protein [Fretibacterium sp.]